MALLVSGKISHYCLELKMCLYILEWRFEPAQNFLLQDGTLIRGRKRNTCLIGKAEQPNSIHGVAPKCFSTPKNVFNIWQHIHNLLYLFLCHATLSCTLSISPESVCLMFRILEDDLDLCLKDTQLFLSANILSYIFIS